MAVYKVAQDVEADDKLIGPFSFRQFVYLIIVALAGGLAWGLSRLFIGLAIIPLPIILFFGALALPLRKDQPMEVYLAAMLSFYLKPRKRLWSPDGIESLIEITAPKTLEVQRTKDLSQSEAENRLSYLANIADTQGWAIRHAVAPGSDSSLNADVLFTAQQTEDILDANGGVAQSLDTMITASDERRRQDMIDRMRASSQTPQGATVAVAQPATIPPSGAVVQPQLSGVDPFTVPSASPQFTLPAAQAPVATSTPTTPQYNPYPTIHQTVIQPIDPQQPTPPVPAATQPDPVPVPAIQNTEESTSITVVSPDIISLANNSDLSIETIQREANRIQHKDDDAGGEVYVSLH